jgi:membrane-associated protease RseP (regulator of RpoE activity)
MVDPRAEAGVMGPSAPRPPGARLSRHVWLFVATVFTTTFAGIFWGARTPEAMQPASALARGLTYSVSLLAILGAHEMGHYLVCRYYGIRATLPFFIPGIPVIGTFGAVIRIRSPIPNRKALFDVAAAGPLAGFVIALPIFLAGLWQATPVAGPFPPNTMLLGRPVIRTLLQPLIHDGYTGLMAVGPLYGAGWVGLLVTALNLFPVGQLDGGHMAYAISRRLHRALAYATLVAMAGLIIAQVVREFSFPAYLLWFAILLWMRDRHPVLVDELSPLPPGRRWIAIVLAIVWLLCFMPVPVTIVV